MEEAKIQDNKVIKLLVLESGQTLISEVEEVVADIGEPNCKLTNPFILCYESLTNGITFKQWLIDFTEQEMFLISSDKILTIVDPKSIILKKYQSLLKK